MSMGYKSENVTATFMSPTEGAELEPLIGKTVAKITSGEYNFLITFEDGSTLELTGATYGDCSMGVDIEIAPDIMTRRMP